jgi:hypothetical protein
MITRSFLRVAVVVVAVACLVPATQAATYYVPTPSMSIVSISDAISSASAGDTIEITNSMTYVEDVDIPGDKPGLTIMASPGQNPTIVNSGTGQVVNVNDGAQPFQLGSNSGGRINVGSYEANVSETFDLKHTSSTVTLENLFISEGSNEVWYHNISGMGDATVIVRDVDINKNNDDVGQPVWRINADLKEFRCERMTVIANNYIGVWADNGTHEINIDSCQIGSFNPGEYKWTALHVNDGSQTINVTDSVLIGGYGSPVEHKARAKPNAVNISSGDTSHTVTINNSVILSDSNTQVDPGTGGIAKAFIFTGPSGTVVALDHCDIISSGVALMMDGNSTPRSLTVTNSNLVSLHSHATSITLYPGDTLSLNYNNLYAPEGVRYGNDSVLDGGGTDYDLDPVYNDYMALDLSYANATLQTGDDSGGPVGTAKSFVGLVPVELSTFQIQ